MAGIAETVFNSLIRRFAEQSADAIATDSNGFLRTGMGGATNLVYQGLNALTPTSLFTTGGITRVLSVYGFFVSIFSNVFSFVNMIWNFNLRILSLNPLIPVWNLVQVYQALQEKEKLVQVLRKQSAATEIFIHKELYYNYTLYYYHLKNCIDSLIFNEGKQVNKI